MIRYTNLYASIIVYFVPCLDRLSQLPEVLLETCCEVSALARSEKKVGGKKKSLLEGSERFRGEGCGELAAEEAAAWSYRLYKVAAGGRTESPCARGRACRAAAPAGRS